MSSCELLSDSARIWPEKLNEAIPPNIFSKYHLRRNLTTGEHWVTFQVLRSRKRVSGSLNQTGLQIEYRFSKHRPAPRDIRHRLWPDSTVVNERPFTPGSFRRWREQNPAVTIKPPALAEGLNFEN